MENKNPNPGSIFADNGVVQPPPVNAPVGFPGGFDSDALQYQDPMALNRQPKTATASLNQSNIFMRVLRRADVILAILLLLSMIGVLIVASTRNGQPTNTSKGVSAQYATQDVPLGDFVANAQGVNFGTSSVVVNGTTLLNGGLVLTPSLQPSAPKQGQIYFDQDSDQLAYYNGQDFVGVGTGVTSVQGLTGAVALTAGTGIAINGTTISSTASGGSGTIASPGGTSGRIVKFTGVQTVADSLLSESGAVVTLAGDLTVANGLTLGTALSVTSGGTGSATLTANGVLVGNGTSPIGSITAGAAGQCLLSTAGAPAFAACPGGGGGVSSLNSQTGIVTLANATGAAGTVTLDNATAGGTKGIATFNGTNFSDNGAGTINTTQNINTGASPTFAGLTLSSALTVPNGGTGGTTFTSNGLLYGNGAGALQATSAGTGGQVLLANGSGVPTFTTFSGDLAVSGTGVTTIQANSVALTTDTTGNYVQGLTAGTGIDVTGTPGEAWSPTVAVLYGSSSGTAVQGNTGITVTAGTNLTGGGSITLGAGGTVTLNVANSPTFSGTLTVQGATATIGTTSQQGSLVLHDGNGETATLRVGSALAANTIIAIPTAVSASDTVCLLTLANCVGTGGGVSGSGTNNRMTKFTSTGSTVGDSTISDNGTTVTTSVDVVVQGGDATIGTVAQQGSLILHDGNGETATLRIGSGLGANTIISLPSSVGASDTVCLLTLANCVGSGTGSTLQAAYDAGNTITTSGSRDIAFTLDNDSSFTVSTAATRTGFTTFSLADGSNASPPAQLVLVRNNDTNQALAAGFKITSAAGGITTALDVSGSNITNAINIGTNNILSNSVTISSAELNLLDGRDAALVDTNDAVSTAITGTGALNSGSITSGFSSIDVGTDSIQGGTATLTGASALTLGTTGTNTGAILLKGSTAASGTITLTLVTNNPSTNTISLPNETGTVCTTGSVCSGYAASSGSTNYIQNQSGSDQSASFRITGTGRANTALQTILLDTPSGSSTLDIGTTNATSGINLNQVTAVKRTSSTAFTVQNGSGGTIMTVDTSNQRFSFNSSLLSQSSYSMFTLNGPNWEPTSGALSNTANFVANDVNTRTGAINSTTNALLLDATISVTGTGTGTKTTNSLMVEGTSTHTCSATNTCVWNGVSSTNKNTTTANITQNAFNLTPTGVTLGALNGLNIGNITAGAGTETAMNIGTGWDSILTYNGGSLINGTGILQSAALSGTYSNTLTLSSASNVFTGSTYNGLTLTSAADGFTVAGGTTGRTLTVTAADITVGSTIKPTSSGALTVQSNGANTLTLDAGGAAGINIGTTNANAVTLGSNGGTSTATIQGGTGGVSITSGANIVLGTSNTTGTLLVLDDKTGSGDPTGVVGGMYYNSNRGKFRCFEYDSNSSSGYWRDCMASARTGFYYVNDLFTTVNDSYTKFEGEGGNSCDSTRPAAVGRPGIIRCGSGSSTNWFIIGHNDSQANEIIFGNGDFWRYETSMMIPSSSNALSTTAQHYILRMGFLENSEDDSQNGCFFRYTDDVNSGKWQGYCVSGGSSSTCDTGTTVALDAWYRLTVSVNSAGNSADFQIDGVSKCQVTTNIPTTAGNDTAWGDVIDKTNGSTDRFIDVDYVEILGQLGTGR